mmetsp:Transcript_15207/g.32643  ORF Transcript_15207/g.32643 Transcript_15207/m.32643 type:complete len:234 (+) Transcript_15207:1507-2208(+)
MALPNSALVSKVFIVSSTRVPQAGDSIHPFMRTAKLCPEPLLSPPRFFPLPPNRGAPFRRACSRDQAWRLSMSCTLGSVTRLLLLSLDPFALSGSAGSETTLALNTRRKIALRSNCRAIGYTAPISEAYDPGSSSNSPVIPHTIGMSSVVTAGSGAPGPAPFSALPLDISDRIEPCAFLAVTSSARDSALSESRLNASVARDGDLTLAPDETDAGGSEDEEADLLRAKRSSRL